jgi:hypothetical protein
MSAPALGVPSEPSSLLRRALKPGETIIWSGRPRTGLAPGDGEAALVAAIVVFSALGTASILAGWENQLGTARAGLAACVLGLAVALGRATISGATLTLGLALQAPMFALAAAKMGLAGFDALVCPLGSLAFLVAWAAFRGLGYRSLRYHISAERGFIERPGFSVISFEFEGPPDIVASRLAKGALGTVRFVAARGRVLLGAGAVVLVPKIRFEFVRVEEPEELVRVWEACESAA